MRKPDPERSRVLLIGTARYSDEALTDLPAVYATITDLAAAFTDSKNGIVAPIHCNVLMNESDIRMLGNCLKSVIAGAEDLLLVYYAGHGLVAGRRHELYLALTDSEWADPEFNSLEYAKLRNAILGSRAKNKIVILDCCFSGRVISDALADPTTAVIGQVEVDGTYVLTSASRSEVSLVLPGERHTAFSGRLLGLLRNGIQNAPELLSIHTIYQELVKWMNAESLPIPREQSSGNAGYLGLFRNVSFREPYAVYAEDSHTTRRARATARQLIAGRYEIDQMIGQGSSGIVYSAEDKLLNRKIAVKILRSDLVQSKEALANFRTEAKAAASILHPSVARLYDYGESGEPGAYIVMELVNGESLDRIIGRTGPIAPDAVLDLVSQAARGLGACHSVGIIHSDIKPANLMIAKGGAMKIIDLGIVRFVRGEIIKTTNTGVMLGAIHYMAPEVILGDEVDVRSDLYSLGCVAYEMLTGRVPFGGDSAAAIIHGHLNMLPVPPHRMYKGISQPVSDFVLRMIERTPSQRIGNADEVAAVADRLRTEPNSPTVIASNSIEPGKHRRRT
jgi:tRNA A-37 threonylcarbamoyl transferase component Bud32